MASQEDEIEAWNAYVVLATIVQVGLLTNLMCVYRSIRELRSACLKGEPPNREFWEKVQEVGRPLSLISKPEAAKAGGKSSISETEAETVSGSPFFKVRVR